jgi:hypothetical protein
LRRESSGSQERTKRSLQSRWDIIKAEMGKFCSFCADCVRENRRGMSDAEKVWIENSLSDIYITMSNCLCAADSL